MKLLILSILFMSGIAPTNVENTEASAPESAVEIMKISDITCCGAAYSNGTYDVECCECTETECDGMLEPGGSSNDDN